jgi:hypothetical protein
MDIFIPIRDAIAIIPFDHDVVRSISFSCFVAVG